MLRELSYNLALLRGHDQQGVLFRCGKDDSELEIRCWLGNPVLFLLYPASLTLLKLVQLACILSQALGEV